MYNLRRLQRVTLVLLLMIIATNSNFVISGAEEEGTTGLNIGVLAAYTRNRESNSSLIGLRHLLDEVGVPYQVIEPSRIASQDIVKVFPAIIVDSYLGSGTLLSNEILGVIEYVRAGGVLIAVKPEGSALAPVFGFSSRRMSNRGFFLEWRPEALSTDILRHFDQPEEKLFRFVSGVSVNSTTLSVVFTPTTAQPLADILSLDGTKLGAGILRNRYGSGLAYALGIGWTDSILRFETEGFTRGTNIWRPNADVIRLLILSVLRNDVPNMVVKSTVPFGYRSALVLTHDVDARSAYDMWAPEMAEMEKARHVNATYFLTTRYFGDKIDRAYWNPQTVQRLRSLGMSIGSHGVTHYGNFTYLPVGNDEETQATYIPHSNPTLTGEIRVSAEMLRAYTPINSWRSPGLLDHEYLTFYLEQNGYEFRSVTSTASVGTNFPYVLMLNGSVEHESSIFEFPVALGDIGLNMTNLYSYVDLWKEIIRRNRNNGAPTTILVHPTSPAKVTAAREIIEWALLEGDIWVTDGVSFMQFWKLRQKVALEAQLLDDTFILRMTNPEKSTLEGLSLLLPGRNGTLQVSPIPGNSTLTMSITLDTANEMMILDTTAESNGTRASVQALESQTAPAQANSKEVASAKEELALATQLLNTSPNEALRHVRIARAHMTLAVAFDYVTGDELDEEPIVSTTKLTEFFDTTDQILILFNAILYGAVFIVRKGRKNKRD